jgi:type III secretion protein D
MEDGILFTIFTGVHAGAEIRLVPGEYVLGSAEDCDVVLTDSSLAPRHLTLTVAAQSVRVSPLEGVLSLKGAPCAEAVELPEATPLLAGLVCFAWVRPGQGWGDMKLPSLLDALADAKAGSETAAENDQNDAQKPAPANETLSASPPPTGAPEAQTGGVKPPPRAAFSRKRVLLWGLAALLLSSLTLDLPPLLPTDQDASFAALTKELDAAGFTALQVYENKGRVFVTGLLATPEDAKKARAIAARQPYAVQVIVRDQETFIKSVQSLLAGHALFPQVRFDDQGAVLRGYVQDSLVERAALSLARGVLPYMVDIRSALVTREQVEATLLAELKRAGLDRTVSVDWLPGVIALVGPGAANPALDNAIRAVRAALQAPLAFQKHTGQKTDGPGGGQIYVDEATPATPVPPPPIGAEPEKGGPFAGGLTLRSVTSVFQENGAQVSGLPFIITSDGGLYFVGGTLPGGYTLTGIYEDRLEFSHNDSLLAYKLQGR